MTGEAERADAYADTIKRIEPDIAMIDTGAALASISISLKRIADVLAHRGDADTLLADRLYDAIYNALVNADERDD